MADIIAGILLLIVFIGLIVYCAKGGNLLIGFIKSFPNRRTIENSDLCADTHEKLQFLGKVGYKQAKNNISGLEIIAP